ncbi:MAG: MarR family winged helix-turn-helix transcriptional regulator [Fimbriimonadaceae bacterium]
MKTKSVHQPKRYSHTVTKSQLGPFIATIYELQSAWLEPRLKAAGIRWTTFQLLATVLGAGDDASQAEVARRLAVAPATLSESVQIHVEKGLLTQEASPKDKRKKVLRLTAAGKKKMSSVAKHVQELETHLIQGISPKDLGSIEQSLGKIVENLEKIL